MKRAMLGLLLSVSALLVISASDASALGIGMYGTIGLGTSEHSSFDDDTQHVGAGFVLDTNVAKDRLFNYRLKLGYNRFVVKDYGAGQSEFGFDGCKWDNTFGFGVLRIPMLRLWLGPQLGLSAYSGSNPYVHGDWSLVGVNLGAALGLNINPGNLVTIAFEGGYRITKYWGGGEYDQGSVHHDVDLELDGSDAFFNLALIFRFGDSYQKQ